jgi:hypothetical protein
LLGRAERADRTRRVELGLCGCGLLQAAPR